MKEEGISRIDLKIMEQYKKRSEVKKQNERTNEREMRGSFGKDGDFGMKRENKPTKPNDGRCQEGRKEGRNVGS